MAIPRTNKEMRSVLTAALNGGRASDVVRSRGPDERTLMQEGALRCWRVPEAQWPSTAKACTALIKEQVAKGGVVTVDE